MAQQKKRGDYRLDQSPFYKLRSQKRLAALLRTDLKGLDTLLDSSSNYRVFPQGKRMCHDPKPKMKAVHKRIQILLNRIAPPEYLHSATKGRSYITNAAAHAGAAHLHKMDIKSFYDSTTFTHVYDFFFNTMLCSKDVTTLLSRIATYDDHLPTGSPLSPILSFFAHKLLFDEIYDDSKKKSMEMTCYVDDLNFSGNAIAKDVLNRAKTNIVRRGLRYHKQVRYQPSDVKVVTGVGLKGTKLLLPNRRHKKIFDEKIASAGATDTLAKRQIVQKLISRVGEAVRIDPDQFMPLKNALLDVNRQISKSNQQN